MAKTCFVIMPYGGSDAAAHRHFLGVFTSILAPAARAAGYDVRRSDLGGGPGNITQAIIKDLANTDVVLADLTGGNANVLFELGIRHVIRKRGTVHVVDKAQHIPFDLRPYRAVEYVTEFTAIPEIIAKIVDAIRAREEEPDVSDNPVHDTFPGLPRDFRDVGEEAQRRQIQDLQASVEELRRDREHLELKLEELDPTGSYRDETADVDIDALFDNAERAMKSGGPYALLRLKQALAEGPDNFVSELRAILKSPNLNENDLMEIALMCQQLDLLDHRLATLEVAHRRYPNVEEIFFALID